MAEILRLEDMVACNIQSASPNLAAFYSQDKVVELLKKGDDIAEFVLKEKEILEKDYKTKLEQEHEKALSELEATKKKAYEEGVSLGKEEALKQFEGLYQFIQDSSNNLVEKYNTLLLEAEQEIVELSLKIAEKITISEISCNKEILVKLVKSVLQKVVEYNKVSVQVNPDDYAFLAKYADHFKKEAGMVKELQVEENAAISKSGVVFEMSSGIIDAQIEVQIRKIREALINE